MAERKILKAFCKKTNQNYILSVEKIGSEWKVIDFVDITANEAVALRCEVRQGKFETHTSLLPCRGCGSRVVSGCNCTSPNSKCKKGMYNFQCIYCKELKIDYSEAKATQGIKDGDIIRLAQGQVVKISLPNGKSLEKMFVGLGWDPVTQGISMDIDSSVVLAGEGNEHDIVYFGNLVHSSGCVIHHGDNLTGRDCDTSGRDDENITVDLKKVPADKDRMYFVLNIYSSSTRGQTFKNVKNLYIRIYEPDSRRMLLQYKIDANLKNETALVLGKAFRNGDGWSFQAIGKPSNASDIGSLARVCIKL